MSDKHPLIVFSGGMDSSFMLYQALLEGDVHTCYFRGAQGPDKVTAELAARQRLIKIATALTGNKVLSDTLINIGFIRTDITTYDSDGGPHRKTEFGHFPDSAWKQAPQWMFGVALTANGRIHSEVRMGYVMFDDINEHLIDMSNAWYYTNRFSKHQQISLTFPLSKTSKDTILNDMPPELLQNVWICELPAKNRKGQFVPCNWCPACCTILQAIWLYEYRTGRNFKKSVRAGVKKVRQDRLLPPAALDEPKTISYLEHSER